MRETEKRIGRLTPRAGWRLAQALPILLGFGLRLWYALQSEPFVDEPTTLLVARAIASTGVPVLPSGLFYGNDLPFSYLAGGLVALFGEHILVIRAFSIAASVVTIAVLYMMGHRLWGSSGKTAGALDSRWLGFWAALLLALSPAAILWGGRARGYALLGLLVLLAVWSFYLGVKSDGNARRRAGWLLLVVAVYVHPEAGLLLPAFVLGAVPVRGWRWWLRVDRLAELSLAGVLVAARFWLQTALARGQISGLETITGTRLPMELGGDWLGRLGDVVPFFLGPGRWPWTLFALLALGGALRTLRRQGARQEAGPILFLSTCLWLVPLEMTLLLGSTYQSPRYLNMLLPIFALLAAFGASGIVEWLGRVDRFHRWRDLIALVVTLGMVVSLLPAAVEAASAPEKGFHTAFEFVREHWQPGDRVATVAPAYAELVLGHSDYFSLGLDYEEFVHRTEAGEWVDRWLGSPLLRTSADLASTLERVGRLWLVVDEGRLRRRFSPDFAQLVWQQMELASKTDGVMAFASVDEQPGIGVTHESDAVFGKQVGLSGYDLGTGMQRARDSGWGEIVAQPGEAVPLTLYWRAVDPIQQDYRVFVHLVGQTGHTYAQADGPPLNGLQPMSHWVKGETLPDRRTLELPLDLPPGRYRIEVGFYNPIDGDRLPVTGAGGQEIGSAWIVDYLTIPAPDALPAVPDHSVDVDLEGSGDQIGLLGFSLEDSPVSAGGTLPLTLFWQAQGTVTKDYTVFVHLLDAAGAIRGQGDGPPAAGFYPTTAWDSGEVVVDERMVAVDPDAPSGIYQLVVGLYELSTGVRLSTVAGDRVYLSDIEVGP